MAETKKRTNRWICKKTFHIQHVHFFGKEILLRIFVCVDTMCIYIYTYDICILSIKRRLQKNSYTLHKLLDPFLVSCITYPKFHATITETIPSAGRKFPSKASSNLHLSKIIQQVAETDVLKTDHFVGWHPFLIHPNDSLPPIIMEMENGPLGD